LNYKKKKKTLIEQQDSINKLNSGVIEMERSQFLYEQYWRRESVEITGIPPNIGVVKHEDLETSVINVYNEAGVKVKNSPKTKFQPAIVLEQRE